MSDWTTPPLRDHMREIGDDATMRSIWKRVESSRRRPPVPTARYASLAFASVAAIAIFVTSRPPKNVTPEQAVVVVPAERLKTNTPEPEHRELRELQLTEGPMLEPQNELRSERGDGTELAIERTPLETKQKRVTVIAKRVETVKEPEQPKESLEELWSRVDETRATDPEQAARLLQRLIAEDADSGQRALASFLLARLYLDSLDRPKDAAKELERAIELDLPAPLVEDAWAHLADAFARAGDRDRARETQAEYHRRFPNGRHEARMNELGTKP